MPIRCLVVVALVLSGLLAPAGASARVFGTDPIPISVGPQGEAADGASGAPTISGDDRRGTLTAFHSEATNLVSNDTNGASDIFVWSRPSGGDRRNLNLDRPARPGGDLRRVSVTDGGGQADGPSFRPSIDGSLQRRRPHCVAFESQATNLTPDDPDATSDIFVRDLAAGRTFLVSRGVAPAAQKPSIDGACRNVAFQAAGSVFVAGVRRGRPKRVSPGSSPDFSLDGSALAWERGRSVMLRRAGRTTRVSSRGRAPAASDEESGVWGVGFHTDSRLGRRDRNRTSDVYLRAFGRRGGTRRTDLISATRRGGRSLGGASFNGGVTAYAPNRGIVTFVTHRGGQSVLYYRNNNSGNIDVLAEAARTGDEFAIFDVYTSARANFVAFASTGTNFPFDRNGATQDVFFKHLCGRTARTGPCGAVL